MLKRCRKLLLKYTNVQGPLAGTGRRLGRDEDPSSRQVSVPANCIFELRAKDVTWRDVQTIQSIAIGVTDALCMCNWAF